MATSPSATIKAQTADEEQQSRQQAAARRSARQDQHDGNSANTTAATAAAAAAAAVAADAADAASIVVVGGGHRQTSTAQSLQTVLRVSEQMDVRQIELIYRAEGNANLVLALPQFKKVLRLPKAVPDTNTNPNSSCVQVQHRHKPKHQQEATQQQRQQQPEHTQDREWQQGEEKQHQQQQQQKDLDLEQRHGAQHQQQSTSDPAVNQNAKAGDLTMEDFVDYIEVIRRLLGSAFVFETDIVRIPLEADRRWINDTIRPNRPAHRLDKEFCGQFALLLPDATQLPAFDIFPPDLQAKGVGDIYAVEIKPKQGWLLPTELPTLLHFNSTTTIATTTTSSPTTPQASSAATAEQTSERTRRPLPEQHYYRCRYCAMQFLKLKEKKIAQMSSYCPMDLFSGEPARMFAAISALLTCPQNNLRVFRNGNPIHGDQCDPVDSSANRRDYLFSSNAKLASERLQLIKHLLVKCLLKDYEALAGSPSGTVTTDDVIGVGAAAPLPHSRTPAVSLIAQAAMGSATATAMAMTTNQHNAPTARTDTAAKGEVGLGDAQGTAEAATATATKDPTTEVPATPALFSEVEMLCLPKNCVLQKVLHLQLLAKRNFRFMFESGYARKAVKSYRTLRELLWQLNGAISFESLQPVEQYLLGATAMDCSIMVAFQEVTGDIANFPKIASIVEVPEYGRAFRTKVTILDLDPKPDSHFYKYLHQTLDAYKCTCPV